MTEQLQLRRGTATQIASATGAAGEVFVDTTNNTLVVQDSLTAGGFRLAKLTDVGILPVYPIASLPSASGAAGKTIYISDVGGGGSAATSDGTNWRLLRETNYNANATTTGAVALAPLTDANIQRFTTTLTGNLTITYGTTNAYKGMLRRTISPAALGGFTFTASGKSLTASQWVEHVYDGSAWQEAAFGSL